MDIEATALRLVGPIYDAATDPALWPEVLKAIGDAVASIASAFTIEQVSSRNSNINVSSRIDPAFQKLYNEYYGSINLQIERARSQLAPGRVVSAHTLCTDQEVLSSEYYQDFLRPQDWFYPFGGCVSSSESLMAVVTFVHSHWQGPCTREQETLLELLLPHLNRAVRLHQLWSALGGIVQSLDSLPIAVVLANRTGRVLFTNQAARRLLALNDGIRAGVDGLVCSDRQAQAQIRRYQVEVGQNSLGRGLGAGGTVAVRRPSGKRPFCVTVSPIRNTRSDFGADRPCAILLVFDPESRVEGVEPALRRLYQLTRAEARLAAIMIQGTSLKEACGQLHIQETTAKTHLRNLFSKTGVARQGELIAVLCRSVAAISGA